MTVTHAPFRDAPQSRSRQRARARFRWRARARPRPSPSPGPLSETPRAGWFRRSRAAGRLGAVGVTRLLGLQLIQVAVLLLVVRNVWVAVAGGVLGAAAVVAVFGRWQGRWATELAALWLRYRRHRGSVPFAAPGTGAPADLRLRALRQLVGDLTVEDVPGAEPGTHWGMGSDGAGWFAVLEVETTDAGVHPPVPMSGLAEIVAEAEQPGVVIQVVSHTASPQRGAPRALWVAVRLDAQAVAESVVDAAAAVGEGGQPDVPAVLAEISRRVSRLLRRRRLHARLLDADGVLAALSRSCDLAPGGAPGGAAERAAAAPSAAASGPAGPVTTPSAPSAAASRPVSPGAATGRATVPGSGPAGSDDPPAPAPAAAPVGPSEQWRSWRSERLVHRCYWLRSWPDPERGTTLLAGLSDLPANLRRLTTVRDGPAGSAVDAQVTLAFVLEPGGPPTTADLRCLVRVAAVPEAHQLVCERAEQLTNQLGGWLFPLDGEQALGVYGTAPTGGGAR